MLRAMLDSFEQQTIRPHAVILVENGVDKPTLKDIFDEWANTTSISLAQYLCNEEASKRKAQVMGIRLLNELNIGIDGGVTLDNVQEIKDAGANFFIAGSAVFKPRERMAENVKAFNAILHA